MSELKSCPVCQEQLDQCLSCASYVVDGERIYYEKLKDFGATKDHEIRFINRIQKHRVTAFFYNEKLYTPSRQGRSVPLAIGLQWDAWQEQQAKIDELQKENAALVHVIKSRDIQLENEKHEYDELVNKLVDSKMKNTKLQKRVDAALEITKQGIRKQGGDYYLEKLEQALNGGDE